MEQKQTPVFSPCLWQVQEAHILEGGFHGLTFGSFATCLCGSKLSVCANTGTWADASQMKLWCKGDQVSVRHTDGSLEAAIFCTASYIELRKRLLHY